jgi:hypothetical protein
LVRVEDLNRGDLPLHQAHLATGRVEQIGVITEFRDQYNGKDNDCQCNDDMQDIQVRGAWRWFPCGIR